MWQGKKIKEKKAQGKSIGKGKKEKQWNGFNLNRHDINRRFDQKIQHKEFNFHGDRTNKKNENKKGMRG